MAGNQISSFLNQVLLLGDTKILFSASRPPPLHLLPPGATAKIVSSGLSEVNLTLPFSAQLSDLPCTQYPCAAIIYHIWLLL